MACPERRQDLTSDLLTPSLTLLELCVHIYLFLNSIRIRMAGLLRLRDWYLGDRCGILWSPLYVCAFAYLQNRRLTHKLNVSSPERKAFTKRKYYIYSPLQPPLASSTELRVTHGSFTIRLFPSVSRRSVSARVASVDVALLPGVSVSANTEPGMRKAPGKHLRNEMVCVWHLEKHHQLPGAGGA